MFYFIETNFHDFTDPYFNPPHPQPKWFSPLEGMAQNIGLKEVQKSILIATQIRCPF